MKRKQMEQFIKKRKVLFFLMAFFLTLVGTVTSTNAWQSGKQQALNQGKLEVFEQEGYLLKLAKDHEGNETELPIAGTGFYLYQLIDGQELQLGGLYTTDEAGRIPFKLPVGDYVFVEVQPTLPYTYDREASGAEKQRYPFTIHSGVSRGEIVVVAYNQPLTSSLVIHKEVRSEDDSPLADAQQKQLFQFEVTFSDHGTYTYEIAGKEYSLTSGDTLELHHNQQAVFEKLPLGLQYTVVEKSMANYQVAADNTSGTIEEETKYVPFVNTYLPTTGELILMKEVVMGNGEISEEHKEQEFTFTVEFDSEERYAYTSTLGRTGTVASGETVTLVHGEELLITGLPLGMKYALQEETTTDYTSGTDSYKGIVQGIEPVTLAFKNQYKIAESKTGELSIEKQVVRTDSERELEADIDEFEFILTFSDAGVYEYEKEGITYTHHSGDPLTLKEGEAILFIELPAGLGYQLEELPAMGYLPQLEAVSGRILSDELISIVFTNHQEVMEELEELAELVIEKHGVGEGFDQDKEFEFKVWLNDELLEESIFLKAGESSDPIFADVGTTWRVVEVDSYEDGYSQTEILRSTGTVVTGDELIVVSQTNTYVGRVLVHLPGQKTWEVPIGVDLPERITLLLKDGETTVAIQEVTGPDWQYEFQVLKYREDGTEIDYTIEEEAIPHFVPSYEEDSLNVTNSYVAPVLSRGLPVEKVLTGDTPEREAIFEFRLNPGNQVLQITGAGTDSFEPMAFEQAGTYDYTITEKNQGEAGYTYDSTFYIWTVVVEEQAGELVIVSETMIRNGEVYEGATVVFENSFDRAKLIEEELIIAGTKHWEYGSQPEGQRPTKIIVELYANGKLLQQREVTAEDNWRYRFVQPAYDEAGKKITYTIKEAPVEGYEQAAKGYDLYNRYVGETSSSSSSSSSTKESESSTDSTSTKDTDATTSSSEDTSSSSKDASGSSTSSTKDSGTGSTSTEDSDDGTSSTDDSNGSSTSGTDANSSLSDSTGGGRNKGDSGDKKSGRLLNTGEARSPWLILLGIVLIGVVIKLYYWRNRRINRK